MSKGWWKYQARRPKLATMRMVAFLRAKCTALWRRLLPSCEATVRHVIVHAAGIVDRKMLGQIRGARPRSLMLDVRENEKIQFTEAEVRLVSSQMSVFLQDLIMNVAAS